MDLIYYDIKIADPKAHTRYVGKPNQRILHNLQRLHQEKRVEVHPRIPLVPNITATRDNLSAIVDLLCEAGSEDVSLLPYNPLGIEMAASLGRSRPPLPELFMTPDEERETQEFFMGILERKNCPSSPE